MEKYTNLDHLHSFVVVAEAGSLSAAVARGAGTRAKLSRHILEIETTLKITLFRRTNNGLVLSRGGQDLLELASDAVRAARAFVMAAAEQKESVIRPINIVASGGLANYLLPEILSNLSKKELGLHFSLLNSKIGVETFQHDTDLVIQTYEPKQKNVYSKCLGQLKFGAYASLDYLEKRGEPRLVTDLNTHDLVNGNLYFNEFKQDLIDLGVDPEIFFKYHSNSFSTAWSLVVAGCGIGITALKNGNQEPKVKRIFTNMPPLSLPIWISSSREFSISPSLRLTYEFIEEEIRSYILRQD